MSGLTEPRGGESELHAESFTCCSSASLAKPSASKVVLSALTALVPEPSKVLILCKPVSFPSVSPGAALWRHRARPYLNICAQKLGTGQCAVEHSLKQDTTVRFREREAFRCSAVGSRIPGVLHQW